MRLSRSFGKWDARIFVSVTQEEFYPPHQSLPRQLPPEGKPFARFLLHYTTRRTNENLKHYLKHHLMLYLLCSHGVKKASPWGEAVAEATDEGG